jgi:hypothetical protein
MSHLVRHPRLDCDVAYIDSLRARNTPFIDVTHKDFGAVGDGTTDDQPAIQAAIDAIADITSHPSGTSTSQGGTVVIPASTFRVDGVLNVPYGVSLIGIGGKPRLLAGAAGARIVVDSHDGSLGNRFGRIENLWWDGNNVGNIGFYVGKAVGRYFVDCDAWRCTDAGVILDGTQNCTFVNINSELNGSAGGVGANLRIENAANNNTFLGLKLRTGTPHNLYQTELASISSYASYFYGGSGGMGPTGNNFHGGIIETLDPTNGAACVFIRAGFNNSFMNMLFTITDMISSTPLIFLDDDGHTNGAATSDTQATNFYGCQFQGTAGQTTIFKINDANNTRISNCNIRNGALLFDFTGANDEEVNNTVLFDGSNHINAVDDYVNTSNWGVDPALFGANNLYQVIKGGYFRHTLDVLVNATTLPALRLGTDIDDTLASLLEITAGGRFDWNNGVRMTTQTGTDGAAGSVPFWDCQHAVLVGREAGITASGTQSQGQRRLTKSVNEISTCAVANDVVTLPPAQAGALIVIINNGAQSLRIFPDTGDNCGAGANTHIDLAAGWTWRAEAYDSTNWRGGKVQIAVA